MAFSDFDLKRRRERFGLTTDEGRDLFSGTPALDVPARLREFLDEWAPAALAMNTEKARSGRCLYHRTLSLDGKVVRLAWATPSALVVFSVSLGL